MSLTVAKALADSAPKLVLLFVSALGVSGFLLAVVGVEAITGILLFAQVVRTHGMRFDARTFGPVPSDKLPLVPVGLVQMGLHHLDRILIKQLEMPAPVRREAVRRLRVER